MRDARPKRPGEATFGIVMLALATILAWQAYGISGFESLSSPGAVPMAAAAAMVIAGVLVVIGDRRMRDEVPGPVSDKARSFSSQITPSVVVVFSACVVAYAALLDTLGFLPASFLFLLVSIQFLHRGSFLGSVGLALVSLAAIYVVFRLIFTVVLPEGIVPEREIIAAAKGLFIQAEGK